MVELMLKMVEKRVETVELLSKVVEKGIRP